MHVKSFLIAIGISFLFFSCSKKERRFEEINSTTPEEVVEATENFLHISANVPKVELRALSSDPRTKSIQQSIATNISNVSILIYNSETGDASQLIKKISGDAFFDDSENSIKSDLISSSLIDENGISINFEPIPLTKDEYKIVVIINSNSILDDALLEGSSIELLNNPIRIIEELKTTGYLQNNLMATKGGPVTTKPTNFSINKTDNVEEKLSFTIEPLVSYFTLEIGENLIDENILENVQVSDEIEVFPDANVKWLRLYGNLIKPLYLDGKEADFEWMTPAYTIEDTSHDFLSVKSGNHFVYIVDQLLDSEAHKPITFTKENIAKYGILTETTNTGSSYLGYSTPSLFLKLSYAPNGINLGESWASYKGRIFNEDDFKTLCKKVSSNTDSNLNEFERNFKKDYLKASKDKQHSKFSLIEKGLKYENSFSANGIKYYKNGVCFYRVPIIHKYILCEETNQSIPIFGTKRNHLYKINLKSISSPGEPCIYDYSRDVKYEEQGHISFDADIPYATVVEIDVEL